MGDIVEKLLKRLEEVRGSLKIVAPSGQRKEKLIRIEKLLEGLVNTYLHLDSDYGLDESSSTQVSINLEEVERVFDR